MKFELIDNCPVPAELAPTIREIKRLTGATLNSCDRSPEAEPFLKRCTPAKQSQRELYEGFRLGKPGYNPANPPGQSTHERRNDGVAYPGPAKLPLPYWCVGMDWENADGVIEAAAKLGFTATRTYPLSAREKHHLNFRKEPKLKLLKPLRLGSKGPRVARMAKLLASITDGNGDKYLERGQGVFDATLENALKRFQADWDQDVDGVFGVQTGRQLAVAVRAEKEKQTKKKKTQPAAPKLDELLRLGSKGPRVAQMAKQLASITDGEGKRYLEQGQGVFDATLESALKRFQADRGLDADGVFGAQTGSQLAAAVQAEAAKAKQPAAPTIEKPLRLGSKGPRVAQMAKLLASIRDRAGKPYLERGQGIFDATLESALKRFQADQGLDADGVVGAQTSGRLAAAAKAGQEKQRQPAASDVEDAVPKKAQPPVPKKPPSALSKEGAKMIAAFEGFRAQLYNDAANHCTIGYGHLVHHGPIDGSEAAEFRAGISQERALELLQEDAAKAAAEIVRSVKVPLEQHQFDALVSFAFNVGNGAFRDSTLLRLLNEGDYDSVEAQLARWNKAGGQTLQGLVNRRAAEAKFFKGAG